MDLLPILINPDKVRDVCCLCYKKGVNTTSLNEGIEIHDEYFELNLTIKIIMKNLFPAHDFVLTQICEDCSTLVIKFFTLMQRSCMKNEILNYVIQNIDQEVEEMDIPLLLKKKRKFKLKVNLPTTENIMNVLKTEHYTAQCEKCLMKFRSKLLLKKHIHISHKNTNNAIVCDTCGKIFTNNARLKAHLDIHKQKQCPYCFKLFKSYSHFKLHVKSHKLPVKIKRTIKYYKCNDCAYRSCNKCSLEAHINKVHLHIKPFTCNICQKSFYKKVHLKEHLMTHNNTRDKTCDICGDTFVNNRTLNDHLRLHNGQKPYKCDTCNIGFITSGRRLEHIKRKHMEKTECCYICDKKFSLKKDVNTHLKNVHGSEGKEVSYGYSVPIV